MNISDTKPDGHGKYSASDDETGHARFPLAQAGEVSRNPRHEAHVKVRLSAKEIEIIRATVSRLLGDRACIRIFGSRARENEKGGDIDILVETEQQLLGRVASACRLASELQMQLGDQKIESSSLIPKRENSRFTG